MVECRGTSSLIPCLWNELLSYVEEAWLALYSRLIRPDEERLPLPYKLVDRADSPSGGHSDASSCATAPPLLTLPILTPALDCASSGSTSLRVDEVLVFPWRSSPAYSALLVIVGVYRFLAYMFRIL